MEILISRKCAISEFSSFILRLTPFLLTALTTADFNYTLRNESDKSIEESTRLRLIAWRIRRYAGHLRFFLRNAEQGTGCAFILSPRILPYVIGNGSATTFIAAFIDSDAAVARFFTPDENEGIRWGFPHVRPKSQRENTEEILAGRDLVL